jgi:Na+-translocating ferredoxin:NAD+ oxidoreductase subunit G
MAKTESTLKNMFLTLLTIAVISGASLGYVYKFTKAPIDQAKAAKQQEAIQLVVPPFNNIPTDEMTTATSAEGFELKIFPAKQDGELVGVAIETMTNKGFSGEIKVMVGFKPDGTIINYKVLDHKETPGLGSKMDEWFRPQQVSADNDKAEKPSFFKWLYGIKGGGGGNRSILEKNPASSNLIVAKDGGEIDAITAATISSRAFLDAVRIAYETYAKELKPAAQQNDTTQTTSVEEGGSNE